jgi:hypothetical protein
MIGLAVICRHVAKGLELHRYKIEEGFTGRLTTVIVGGEVND